MRSKKLNFGCGIDIKKGYENVDINKGKGVDKVFDFDKFPYPYKDNTFDEVYSDNVFEHLSDLLKVMDELHRICKKGAFIRVKVPYYNCKGAYDDPTHKHYFNRETMKALAGLNARANLRLNKFELEELALIPTRLGKLLIFSPLIHLASIVIGEVVGEVYAVYKVVK